MSSMSLGTFIITKFMSTLLEMWRVCHETIQRNENVSFSSRNVRQSQAIKRQENKNKALVCELWLGWRFAWCWWLCSTDEEYCVKRLAYTEELPFLPFRQFLLVVRCATSSYTYIRTMFATIFNNTMIITLSTELFSACFLYGSTNIFELTWQSKLIN